MSFAPPRRVANCDSASFEFGHQSLGICRPDYCPSAVSIPHGLPSLRTELVLRFQEAAGEMKIATLESLIVDAGCRVLPASYQCIIAGDAINTWPLWSSLPSALSLLARPHKRCWPCLTWHAHHPCNKSVTTRDHTVHVGQPPLLESLDWALFHVLGAYLKNRKKANFHNPKF